MQLATTILVSILDRETNHTLTLKEKMINTREKASHAFSSISEKITVPNAEDT